MKDEFINAIHSMNKVRLTFYSKKDGRTLTRTCAPMDYGPSYKFKDKSDRFHFWDYDSDTGRHPLPLKPDQIHSMEVLDCKFDPAEFVAWETKWHINRNWGHFS